MYASRITGIDSQSGPARKTDGALIATAYYYKVSQMLAKFARLQGLEDEAKEFEKDAAKIKDCFNARFLTVKKGTSPVQMPHVLYPDSIFYGNNTVTLISCHWLSIWCLKPIGKKWKKM